MLLLTTAGKQWWN